MENADKYLLKKNNPDFMVDEGRKELLKKPIGEILYDKEGDVQVENDKLRLEFRYDFAPYSSYCHGPDENEGILARYPRSNDYRILRSFVIADKSTNKTIDILADMPKGYSFIFVPFFPGMEGEAIPSEGGCIVLGNIATLEGIMVSIHEIGHCIDYENAEDKGDYSGHAIKTAPDKDALAKRLRQERNASAYLLNKIRPLFSSGAISKDLALSCVHGISLYYHGKDINKRIKELDDNSN